MSNPPEHPQPDQRDVQPVGKEIERKFHVREAPDNLETYAPQTIEQGYAYIGADGSEVRLRRKGEKFYLTGKIGSGQSRLEREHELSPEQYHHLWETTTGRRLEKTRYSIPHADGVTIELDIYNGDFDGLVSAEVEFPDEETAAKFVPPDWFGEEITEDQRFKNQSLALHGLPDAEQEREPAGNPEYDITQGLAVAHALIDLQRAALERPVIVTLAGGTASGKTKVVGQRLIESYGDEAGMLSTDHYYRGGKFMAEQKALGNEMNFDQPEAVDLPLVAQHLQDLRDGKLIERPIYSFKNGGERTGTTPFPSKPVIVAEGLFTLDEQLAELGDVKIYVDLGIHDQFLRRMMRDVTRLDWTPQHIMDYFSTTVAPMHEKYVAATKGNADIVIRNEFHPLEEADRAGAYEQQLKFPIGLSAEQLRKLGAEKISRTTQVDHYLNPHDRELTSSDEMLRIRDEGESKTITYKGPKKTDTPFRKRPKFDFDIDAETQKHFLDIYGKEFETITKERTLYRYHNTLLSVDSVKKTEGRSERNLGTWTEVRFASDATSEDVERIVRALGLDPATARKESYVEM